MALQALPLRAADGNKPASYSDQEVSLYDIKKSNAAADTDTHIEFTSKPNEAAPKARFEIVVPIYDAAPPYPLNKEQVLFSPPRQFWWPLTLSQITSTNSLPPYSQPNGPAVDNEPEKKAFKKARKPQHHRRTGRFVKVAGGRVGAGVLGEIPDWVELEKEGGAEEECSDFDELWHKWDEEMKAEEELNELADGGNPHIMGDVMYYID